MEEARPRSFLDYGAGVFKGINVTPVDDAYFVLPGQARRQSQKLEDIRASETQDPKTYKETNSSCGNIDNQLTRAVVSNSTPITNSKCHQREVLRRFKI